MAEGQIHRSLRQRRRFREPAASIWLKANFIMLQALGIGFQPMRLIVGVAWGGASLAPGYDEIWLSAKDACEIA